MKKKLLDRRGAAIELAIMMMVFSIFITTIVLTTALLQNSHKAKAELGIRQDILLEQLGEDFVDAVLNGGMSTDWLPENYEGITIETIPIHRHEWEEDVPVLPNCEENGYTLRACKSCNETEKIKIVSALGHNIIHPNPIESKAPTCTATGKTVGLCTRCGNDNAVIVVPAKDHDFELSSVDQATCTENGKKIFACIDCPLGYTEDILAGHTPSEIVIETIDPICTEDGKIIYKCANCEEGTCEAPGTPATGHKFGDQAANCMEKLICECGYEETVQHIWDNGTIERAPSCNNEGEKKYTCTECGEMITESVPPIHAFDDGNGKCTTCNASNTYVLTVIAVDRNAYKMEVLDSVPVAEPCETAVLQIVLKWSETDNAYKITEWSKK